MGKNYPKPNDRLFHFQLDLPDRKSNSAPAKQPSETSQQQSPAKNAAASAVSNGPRKQPSHIQNQRPSAAKPAGNTKNVQKQTAVKQRPSASNTKNRQSTAASAPQRSSRSAKGHLKGRAARSERRKKYTLSNLSKQEGAANKAKFLLAFVIFYFGVAFRWFKRELTPEKLLKNEKRPGKFNFFTGFGTLIFFPAAIFFMELVFHIYMKLGIKYIPIYLFFSIAGGFLCALLTSYFPEKINKIIACVLTFLLGLIFCIEIVCKTVLSQYYQLASSASMAVNNHLSDYSGAIFKGIFMNIIGLLLMFVPFILLVTILRKRIKFAPKPPALALLTFIGLIVCHLLALIALHLPYGGDQKPSDLYKTDTEIEEQVRQLGVLTMLRLDIKHSIFGVDRNLSIDSEELQKINSLQQNTETTAEADKTIDTSPNVLDIDFDKLSESTSNESVQWLNEYFSSITPTNKNKYTGMFKGYNVIFITAEGFSGYMIDKELTPTLYKLTHEGFVFNNFYTALHYTSTSNGECQNLLGLYPKNGEPRTMEVVGTKPLSVPFTLANQLNNLGYHSIGYHFNQNVYNRRQSHPQLGYEWNDSDQLELEKNEYGAAYWPQSDNYMVTETFDDYVNKQPFNIYYMTISGHMPYVDNGNSMAVRNYDQVKDLPYSEDTKCYIAANLELEKGLTTLVNKLEEAGIADKTLLVMAPDHIPYFDLPVLEELTGQTFGKSEDTQYLNEENINFDVYKNSLIIWSASMKEPVTVDKVCCQVDILPTVSNLLGLNYDSRLLEGTDILSDSEGLVVFSSKSWKSDKGFYNSYTGEFTLADGVTMSESEIETYVDAMKTAANYKVQATILIQDTDYYSLILPNGVPYDKDDVIEPGSMTSDSSSESGESSDGQSQSPDTSDGQSQDSDTSDGQSQSSDTSDGQSQNSDSSQSPDDSEGQA